jgi:DMSO reductase family type II enzyme chaperone
MDNLVSTPVFTANPMVRSTLYRLLSSAFQYPTPERFLHFQNGDYLSELWDNLAMLPHLVNLMREETSSKDNIQRHLEQTSLEDFQTAYMGTFDVGAPEPPCPPYEGVYLKGVERSGHLIRLLDLYQHFGLKMDPAEGKRELADHLRAELEFLHFLCFKEAQAWDEDKEELQQGYLSAQRDFLKHHLVGWLPAFQARLEAHCPLPFYVWLTRLVAHTARLELDYLNGVLDND